MDMESAGILALVGLLALMVLTILADFAARITSGKASDHVTGVSNMIEIGDALFTAEEYARLVQLHVTYSAFHPSTPTIGGDDR